MDESLNSGPETSGTELGQTFWQHARYPQYIEPLERVDGTGTAVGSCGDRVTIDITVVKERIQGISHKPEGCLYTTACASAVSALAQSRTVDRALEIQPEDVDFLLGGLPEDHRHCARLAVNTLGEAIADYYRQKVLRSLETTGS